MRIRDKATGHEFEAELDEIAPDLSLKKRMVLSLSGGGLRQGRLTNRETGAAVDAETSAALDLVEGTAAEAGLLDELGYELTDCRRKQPGRVLPFVQPSRRGQLEQLQQLPLV